MSRTVLVGFDDSPAAIRALDRAAQEARSAKSELIVLAVLELPVDPTAPRAYGTWGDGAPLTGPFPEPPEIAAILDDARTRLDGTGTRATYLWAPGDPATLLVEAAKEREVDLLVMGEHHHGLLGRLLGADVAGEVRRSADCEVLVVD